MLYLYDRAIAENLQESFSNESDVPVKVISETDAISVAAQLQDDDIQFPVVCVMRNDDYQLDTNRANFTLMKKGVGTVIDKETNYIYNERALPITLEYSITVITTNTADMDELVRELLFKYTDMYFLTIKLPYEADRSIRFGIIVDTDKSIDRSSTTEQYNASGKLYQSIIPLKIDGAVLVHYTGEHLRRLGIEVDIEDPKPNTANK